MQRASLQELLSHILYKHCPAAFNTGNDVATIAFRTLENLLTRRSPWSAEVKALQINSWASRLNFLEDLVKAYDDILDLEHEAVSESIDAFADKLSTVTHKIPHDTLVISMERVHEATASATAATQDVLPSADRLQTASRLISFARNFRRPMPECRPVNRRHGALSYLRL